MIDIKNLTKNFDGITAVDNLSFHVEKGEIFGLLGPNGAGKTTTVRMLGCLISKSSGSAKIGGYNTDNEEEAYKIRKLIGLIPDNVGLYDGLSAYKNLDFYGKLYEVPDKERKENIERLLKLLGLWDKKDQSVGTFSKGMKQKVAIARALVHDPKVLFLDEPTANLDPEASKTVRDFILQLQKEKKTIFLNTHNLEEAQRICDRIGVLKTKMLMIGTPEELKKSLWGSKTMIQLSKINDKIIAAVKKLKPLNMVVEKNRIVIDVKDAEKENPLLVDAIVSAGGNVQFVTELSPSLEDVYLNIVRDKK